MLKYARHARGGRAEPAPHGGRTGESNAVDAGVFDQCAARFVTQARHDVDETGERVGFDEKAHQLERRERRRLRRFDDQRVASGEWKRQHLGEQGDGRIEGRDHADDAERLAKDEGKAFGAIVRKSVAVEAPRFARGGAQ